MEFSALEKKINELVLLYGKYGHIGISMEWQEKKIEYNNSDLFPSASLIKLPILIELYEQAKEGEINLQHLIKIADIEPVGGAGIVQALSSSSTLTIKDLAALMIITSDNMAANFLIDRAGANRINDRCKKLGMHATKLNRKMMDEQARRRGIENSTTPLDMLKCLKEIKKSEILFSVLLQQQLQSKLPFYFREESAIQIANKTGELDGVDHDCAILQFGNQTFYVSVLTEQFLDDNKAKEFIRLIGKCIAAFLKETREGE